MHCRKCWQPISLLTKRCAQCGDVDSFRFGTGVMEVLIYVAVGAALIGLGWWALFHSPGAIAAMGSTELEATTRVCESVAPASGCFGSRETLV